MEVLSMAGAHDPSPPNLISEMALDIESRKNLED